MLVLSRRPGTAIIIDHNVTVTVELVAGDEVCLKVDCPDGVSVERTEVVEVARELDARGQVWDPSRMHVLSRRARPGLVIGSGIRIAVLAISNEAVRIGVDAPAHVEVHRDEVYRQIQEANRSAVGGGDNDLAGLEGLIPVRRAQPGQSGGPS